MAGNTQKFNSLRRQRELERSWDEMSSLGKYMYHPKSYCIPSKISD